MNFKWLETVAVIFLKAQEHQIMFGKIEYLLNTKVISSLNALRLKQ